MKVIRGFMGWYAQLTVPQCDKIILFKLLMILEVYQAGLLVISKE